MPDYYNPYSHTVKDMILSMDEMKVNATFIWGYMKTRFNWTLEATAGMLGNAQAESTINPARPQNNAVNNKWYPSEPGYTGDAPNPTTTHYGFGLWQITPYLALTGLKYNPYTYGNWALDNGYTFSWATGGTGGKMEPQLEWLMSGNPEKSFVNTADPNHDQKKWYADGRSPIKGVTTPAKYGALTATPEDCAKTFYWNFERSDNLDVGDRPEKARYWYNYLSGVTPPTPPSPVPTAKILKGGKNVWRILHLIQQY